MPLVGSSRRPARLLRAGHYARQRVSGHVVTQAPLLPGASKTLDVVRVLRVHQQSTFIKLSTNSGQYPQIIRLPFRERNLEESRCKKYFLE